MAWVLERPAIEIPPVRSTHHGAVWGFICPDLGAEGLLVLEPLLWASNFFGSLALKPRVSMSRARLG